MPNQNSHPVYKIDATNRAVGRVASEAVKYLRGKHQASFVPHLYKGSLVVVCNASQVKFTGKKLVQKDYIHHTMHPGGLKKKSMMQVFNQDPREVIRLAVYGMLPKNKLREEMMKRLQFKV